MIKVTNGSATLLAAGIGTADTTITVTTGTGVLFPTYSTLYPTAGYDYSYAAIEDASHNIEYVKIVNRASDVFTIQRAQEGSTALAFAAGAAFEIRPTAQTIIDLVGTVSKGATGGGLDDCFYENSNTITTDYTITAGKNAVTAGPVTISSGVTVTIPSGSVWSVI